MKDRPPPGDAATPPKAAKNSGNRPIGKTRTSALSSRSEKAKANLSAALNSGKIVLSSAEKSVGGGQLGADC